MWRDRGVGRVARMRLLPLGVLALLLAAGCAAPRDPLSVAAEGDRAVARQADGIARWLDNRPQAMHESLDLARAVLGEPEWTGTEVLSATGDRRDGNAELLLRVTMHHVVDGSSTETRCHLLTQSGRYGSFGSTRRDCPAGAVALTPPPVAPEPTLPPGYADRLAAALRTLPPAQRTDPAAVEAAARRVLGGNPAAVRTATAPSGTVGLAVSAARYDCVLAAVDGSVSVWLPPRIYLEPGEGGCSADAAAARELQHSPH